MFWCLYVLQNNTRKCIKMRNQEGAFKQNKSKAHPSKDSWGQTHGNEAQAHLTTAPAKAVRGDTTHGTAAPPCSLSGPPFGRQCIQSPLGRLHGYLPRIFPQTILGELYKQGEAPSFQYTIIHKDRRRRAPLISLASS